MGFKIPIIISSKVVLPEPLLPKIPKISDLSIVKLMFFNEVFSYDS